MNYFLDIQNGIFVNGYNDATPYTVDTFYLGNYTPMQMQLLRPSQSLNGDVFIPANNDFLLLKVSLGVPGVITSSLLSYSEFGWSNPNAAFTGSLNLNSSQINAFMSGSTEAGAYFEVQGYNILSGSQVTVYQKPCTIYRPLISGSPALPDITGSSAAINVISSSYALTASYATIALSSSILAGNGIVVDATTVHAVMDTNYQQGAVVFADSTSSLSMSANFEYVPAEGLLVDNILVSGLNATVAVIVSASIVSASVDKLIVNSPFSASYALSSSYALTASYAYLALSSSYATASGVAVSAINSIFAISASYAATASLAYVLVVTSSITSSFFALSSSFASASISASYALSASYGLSSSYALSASWSPTSAPQVLVTGSNYPITASNAISASYAYEALSASYSTVTQKVIITGSSVNTDYNITFVSGAVGNLRLYVDSAPNDLSYNPFTNALTVKGSVTSSFFVGTGSFLLFPTASLPPSDPVNRIGWADLNVDGTNFKIPLYQ